MAPTPSRAAARWHLIATIMASVAVGAMLIAAFEKWLRGESFVVWVILMAIVVMVLVISVNAVAVLKRIP